MRNNDETNKSNNSEKFFKEALFEIWDINELTFASLICVDSDRE